MYGERGGKVVIKLTKELNSQCEKGEEKKGYGMTVQDKKTPSVDGKGIREGQFVFYEEVEHSITGGAFNGS